MHIYQLHNFMKQRTTTITNLLHHNSKFLSLLAKRKEWLKYKVYDLLIQKMCYSLFSTCPAGTDFTLQLGGEINFHSGSVGRFPLVFIYRNR